MSKEETISTIEQFSKKYFEKETREAWSVRGKGDPPFWNIFALKAVTKEECFKLGIALIELTNEEKLWYRAE